MFKTLLCAAATAAFALSPIGANAHDAGTNALLKAPPATPYKAVSSLVKLPDFLPGIGQLYVDPKTLPAGPFLAYDHDGKLVSTIYMIPLSLMKADMNLDNLGAAGAPVDHVDVVYNAGHPGVEEPHVHVVLWHVAADQEARVAK
ncbi:hypothetical protein [Pollutimonas harenae]|uniref:Uncharacterized protein n=1 Tax=Pollutimonas harenae TaxID=657015 RepID=A0A853GYJ5_9BURK|nr:hypothetical protein [Pollutimonas harenae]NYT85182.1 hypothetical protein [Pollutimonas harenae]